MLIYFILSLIINYSQHMNNVLSAQVKHDFLFNENSILTRAGVY